MNNLLKSTQVLDLRADSSQTQRIPLIKRMEIAPVAPANPSMAANPTVTPCAQRFNGHFPSIPLAAPGKHFCQENA